MDQSGRVDEEDVLFALTGCECVEEDLMMIDGAESGVVDGIVMGMVDRMDSGVWMFC